MQNVKSGRWYSVRCRVSGAIARLLRLHPIYLRAKGEVHHKWHQDFILHMASIVRPENYLEVGIYRCGLFNQMMPFARKLTGVDLSPEAGKSMDHNPKATFVCSDSADFAAVLKERGETFDFIFIDADHSQEAVRTDFVNYIELLRPHGIMLLHDTHPVDDLATSQERCGDGYIAIEELSRVSDEWEMMTIPMHPGLTVCRKRTKQLSWQESVQ
jgi:predicted O-methyltransferase YrrM